MTDFTDDVKSPAAGSLRAVLAESAPGDVIRFDRPLVVPLAGNLEVKTAGLTIVGPGGIQRTSGAKTVPQLRLRADGFTLSDLDVRDVAVVASPRGKTQLAGPAFLGTRHFGVARVELRNCDGTRLVGCSLLLDPVTKRRAPAAFDDFSSRGTSIEDTTIRIDGGTAVTAQLVHGLQVRGSTITGDVRITPGVSTKRPAPYVGEPGETTFDTNVVSGTVELRRVELQTGSLHLHGNTAYRIAVTGAKPDVENNTLGFPEGSGITAFTLLYVSAARGAGDVRVVGNTTRGGSKGIDVRSSRAAPVCLVEANEIADASSIGIIVSPGGTTTIRGNTVTGGLASAARAGIVAAADTKPWPFTIEDNVVEGSSGTGIFVGSPFPTLLRNNRVSDNGLTGIYVGQRAQAEIVGGVVERNGGNDDDDPAGIVFGIRSSGSVTGTTVRNNVGAGILQDITALARISQVSLTSNSGEGIDISSIDVGSKGKKGPQPEPPSELSFDSAARAVKGKALPGALVEVYIVESGARTGNPGRGEGETFVASGTADGDGEFTIPVTCSSSDLLTLTATNAGSRRSTSEFSADVECVGAAVELASQSTVGDAGDAASSLGTHAARAVSANGRFVVFSSNATNLVPGDTNGRGDVFLRDRTAGTTVRVSLRADGSQIVGISQLVLTDGTSSNGSVSDDGRYVSFTAYANQVIPADTKNLENHVYVHDLVAGTTTAVSGPADHSAASDSSISGDGRYVAFVSADPDWDDDDGNGTTDVFVWDRTNGAVTLESRTTGGLPSGETFNASAQSPRLSSDGRFLVFASAHTLTPGDTTSGLKVFLRDRQTGTTELVSRTALGAPASASQPSVSADGRYVSFLTSVALVTNDVNGAADVYVRDRTLGTVTLASIGPDGTPFVGASGASSLSGDGRFVAFVAPGGHTEDEFTQVFNDVYVRDLIAGTTIEAAVGDAGDADARGEAPALDGAGRVVAFASLANNLVSGDASFTNDVFVRTLPAPAPLAAKAR